jgi:hypothetical protein
MYKGYGLAITSDLPIPELLEWRGDEPGLATRVAIRIRSRRASSPHNHKWFSVGVDPDGLRWFKCARVDGGYLLRFTDLADFFIEARGRSVECLTVAPGITSRTTRHLVLDQVLPRVLNLLGHDSLHATAIATERGACAFVGPPGIGKSTIAASFQLHDYPLVCDDCLVFERSAPGLRVLPGYPGIRLWPDSLEGVGARADGANRVADYSIKLRINGSGMPSSFAAEPQKLRRIYLLSRMASIDCLRPKLLNLSAAEVFPALIAASFPLDITDKRMLMRHFRLFSQVACQIPARRLTVPGDFAALDDVRQAVLSDLEN